MYESFYGFAKAPFSNVPDPELLYLSPQHHKALSLLEYAILSRAGFCVITGDVGTGKTTLVRRVLRELDQNVEVGLVSNTQCDSFEELLKWVMLAFDLDYHGKDKVELYDVFVQFLIERFSQGQPVILIIDEAQHLGPRYLEELRMLSNVNTEKGQVLQTILVGQPELWDLLRRPELSQFAQRISFDYFLGPLESPEQVDAYLRFRLQEVGGEAAIFDESCADQIWRATNGVPRLINLVCDTALVYSYAEQVRTIGVEIINQVLKDKELGFAAVTERVNRIAPPSREADPRVRPPRKRASESTSTKRESTIEKAMAKRQSSTS